MRGYNSYMINSQSSALFVCNSLIDWPLKGRDIIVLLIKKSSHNREPKPKGKPEKHKHIYLVEGFQS